MPGETQAHARLKQLAIRFLRQAGGLAVACEVRCPISRWRFDVAGWIDRSRPGQALWDELAGDSTAIQPRTVVIECKQSRADFLRDSHEQAGLLARRAALLRIRASIERHRIRVLEPQLRVAGSSLFRELDEWDYGASRLRSYRAVVRELRLIDEKLHGHVKFHMISRYVLADRLYVAAPRGLVRVSELPGGWGLLECEPKLLACGTAAEEPPSLFEVKAPAAKRSSKDQRRLRLLRNIAVAASLRAHPAPIPGIEAPAGSPQPQS